MAVVFTGEHMQPDVLALFATSKARIDLAPLICCSESAGSHVKCDELTLHHIAGLGFGAFAADPKGYAKRLIALRDGFPGSAAVVAVVARAAIVARPPVAAVQAVAANAANGTAAVAAVAAVAGVVAAAAVDAVAGVAAVLPLPGVGGLPTLVGTPAANAEAITHELMRLHRLATQELERSVPGGQLTAEGLADALAGSSVDKGRVARVRRLDPAAHAALIGFGYGVTSATTTAGGLGHFGP